MTSTTFRLDRLLSVAAERWPEKVALEDPERGQSITYRELDELASRIRDALVARGVATGDRVAVCSPKSIGSVAAIFGILKAGACYVPMDSDAPIPRNTFICTDCSVRAVVAAEGVAGALGAAIGSDGGAAAGDIREAFHYGVALSILPGPAVDEQAGEQLASAGATAGDLAYILYTSGSTGQPKGVTHTHASALAFVDWCSGTFDPQPEDRFSSHAPFHFDLSILDLYLPIKHGGTLVLIGEGLGKQPMLLAPIIAERRISIWYSTPSILRLLVDFGRLEQFDFSALRVVLFAGEVFPVKHLKRLVNAWPDRRYYNLYGPTETNVCTFFEVPTRMDAERGNPLPIGRTCSPDRARVVDSSLEDVQPGEEGELLISGGTVMLGYWNQPDRNERAFVRDRDGTDWYRTGDIVREAEGGLFELIGRRDRMVKRRGYRVELGEIESALYQHPAITEAAVISVPDPEAGVRIHAHLSSSQEPRPSMIEMKRYCMENLPNYMIPDRFHFGGPLPRTTTDKVDYQTLAALADVV